MAAREVSRLYGLPPRTAWYRCHRIREAMTENLSDVLIGTIIAEETWIGGEPGNRHASKSNLDNVTP
jgi:hypothetical protein